MSDRHAAKEAEEGGIIGLAAPAPDGRIVAADDLKSSPRVDDRSLKMSRTTVHVSLQAFDRLPA
jgi:hypothetical protein